MIPHRREKPGLLIAAARVLRSSMRSLTTALVLLAALASTALAATPERVVATKTSSGGFALAKVSATVQRAATLRVRVTSKPRQTVLVSWTVICKKGKTSSKKVRQYGPTMTPTTRSVPLTMPRPDRCTLSATGQLEKGEGSIAVALLARRR
jgi:hypothetical protein